MEDLLKDLVSFTGQYCSCEIHPENNVWIYNDWKKQLSEENAAKLDILLSL